MSNTQIILSAQRFNISEHLLQPDCSAALPTKNKKYGVKLRVGNAQIDLWLVASFILFSNMIQKNNYITFVHICVP